MSPMTATSARFPKGFMVARWEDAFTVVVGVACGEPTCGGPGTAVPPIEDETPMTTPKRLGTNEGTSAFR